MRVIAVCFAHALHGCSGHEYRHFFPYTSTGSGDWQNSQPVNSKSNRKAIFNVGMIPNIKENPRNRKATKRGRKRLFNDAIHALRMRVERTFAWEDKFKRLLLRFERIQQLHYGMKLMAYTQGDRIIIRRLLPL